MDRQKKVYASHCLRKFDTPHFQEIGRIDNICTQKWRLSNKTKTGVRRTDDFFEEFVTTKSLRITALAGYACGLAASAS